MSKELVDEKLKAVYALIKECEEMADKEKFDFTVSIGGMPMEYNSEEGCFEAWNSSACW